MARISRRRFLKMTAGAAGAAAAAPFARVPWASAVDLASLRGQTTLERTIVKGALLGSGTAGSYYRLAAGPGDPYTVRDQLAPASSASFDWAMAFAHFTDIHLIDAQSPGRVEFLDRFADMECASAPLNAAFRPQETLTLHVLEAMNRKIRAMKHGPATGAPLRFVMCTGDNMDNEQLNELRWFIDLMDGGSSVRPNSGGPDYEGVQAADWGDPEYWHPDPVGDKYKSLYGFPDYPGLLTGAVKPFKAAGAGLPWWQTFGNHDGLMQGNAPWTEAFNAVAVGGFKFDGPPPGINPCDPFPTLQVVLPTR